MTVCASKFPLFCVHVHLTSLLFVGTETLSAGSKAVDDNCFDSWVFMPGAGSSLEQTVCMYIYCVSKYSLNRSDTALSHIDSWAYGFAYKDQQ